MKALVLVGGEGTRLRPLTYTTPKQLLPVAEVPMLERVLSGLASHGVREVVVSLGYRPDAFLSAYPGGIAGGVRLSYVVEDTPLDTAGAIRFAAQEAKISERFLVVNGDVLTDLDVSSLIEFHQSRQAQATIALVAVDDPSRYGVVPTTAEGQVEAFVEKPPPGQEPTNCINAGTYVLEPEVVDLIPAGCPVSVERETFPHLAELGTLYAMRSDEYWIDTGTPAAYLQANADLVGGRRGEPPAPGARSVSPGVWMLGRGYLGGTVLPATLVGAGARVEEGATVEGSVVGAACVVTRGAVVQDSVLLPGVVVEQGASVHSSIVGYRARVGQDSRLARGSIVGDEQSVPEGACLDDERLPSVG